MRVSEACQTWQDKLRVMVSYEMCVYAMQLCNCPGWKGASRHMDPPCNMDTGLSLHALELAAATSTNHSNVEAPYYSYLQLGRTRWTWLAWTPRVPSWAPQEQ